MHSGRLVCSAEKKQKNIQTFVQRNEGKLSSAN